MKYFNYLKYSLFMMSLILAGFSFTACEDDIKLDPVGDYDNIDNTYGAVRNVTGAQELSTITVFGSSTSTGQLYFELTKAAAEAVNVQLEVSQDALDAYNAANGTSYQMYPKAQVSFANNGVVNIAAGSQKSETIDISVTSNGGVGCTYALPVSAKVIAGGVSGKTIWSYSKFGQGDRCKIDSLY